MGRPPLDDWSHRPGGPSRRMALSGTLCAGRAHRRERQCNQPPARRPRSRLVACARDADRALRGVATVGRRRPAHRVGVRGRVGLVDRRTRPAGPLQPARHSVYRNLRSRCRRIDRSGDSPRPRVLVLLRQRQIWCLDRAERRVHAGGLAAVPDLWAGRARLDRGHGGALASPFLLCRSAGTRRPHRHRWSPLRRSFVPGSTLQGLHPHRRRPRPPFDTSCCAHGRPGNLRVARHRGRGSARPSSSARQILGSAHPCGDRARQSGDVEGPDDRGEPPPRRRPSHVLARGRRRVRCR